MPLSFILSNSVESIQFPEVLCDSQPRLSLPSTVSLNKLYLPDTRSLEPRLSNASISTMSSVTDFPPPLSMQVVQMKGSFDGEGSIRRSQVISPSGRVERLSRFMNSEAEKTTVMIRNVPCRCTQPELLEEIEEVVPGVNFLYLPASRKREGNL